MAYKFDECGDCRFRTHRPQRSATCRECDVGELYEDRETPGVDDAFRATPQRFGESVSDDGHEQALSVSKFADQLEDEDEDESHDDDA